MSTVFLSPTTKKLRIEALWFIHVQCAARRAVLVRSVYAESQGLMEGNISTMRMLFTPLFAETLTRPIHQRWQIFLHRPVVTVRHSGANGQWEGYSLDKEGL